MGRVNGIDDKELDDPSLRIHDILRNYLQMNMLTESWDRQKQAQNISKSAQKFSFSRGAVVLSKPTFIVC